MGGDDSRDEFPNEHTRTRNPETWEPHSLSRPFVTPYCKPVQEHEKLELDVGTFSPNQYKNSCLCLYYHPIL